MIGRARRDRRQRCTLLARRIVAAMANARRLASFAGMTAVALVVAHNLVFLLAYGASSSEALAHTGHDGTWRTAVAVVVAASFGLLGLGAWRLYRLGIVVRSVRSTEGGLRPATTDVARQLAGLWLRLTGITILVFVAQENLEHQHAGLGLPGFSVLGSADYPNAALVIAAIALAVASVVSSFRWRRDVLVARIKAAQARWSRVRPTLHGRRARWVERRHASIVVHQCSGRAPPQLTSL